MFFREILFSVFFSSLNRERRMRELLRVTKENQDILKRIVAKKPEYDHVTWEKDWDANLQYMDQIAAFPHDWWKTSKDVSSKWHVWGRETARTPKSVFENS